MSLPRENCCLLINGYIREFESKHKLFQIIADPVVVIVTNFYPKIPIFVKDANNRELFNFSNNDTFIQPKHLKIRTEAIVFIDDIEEHQGYNKGIHLLSIRNDGESISFSHYDPHSGTDTNLIFGVVNTKSIAKHDENIDINQKLTEQDSIWLQEKTNHFQRTKDSILYDLRIYIDIPFDASNKFRDNIQNFNWRRPLNQFDLVDNTRNSEIEILRAKCMFHWIKYWCLKCIERRIMKIPFTRCEPLYQLYFVNVMDLYLNTKHFDDDSLFQSYYHAIKTIDFIENKRIIAMICYDYYMYDKTKLNKGSIVTMILNCNDGEVSYYIDNKYKDKIIIDPKETYYFVMTRWSSSSSKLSIVDSPLLSELNHT